MTEVGSAEQFTSNQFCLSMPAVIGYVVITARPIVSNEVHNELENKLLLYWVVTVCHVRKWSASQY